MSGWGTKTHFCRKEKALKFKNGLINQPSFHCKVRRRLVIGGIRFLFEYILNYKLDAKYKKVDLSQIIL